MHLANKSHELDLVIKSISKLILVIGNRELKSNIAIQ